jgi:predicted solute-binding protein
MRVRLNGLLLQLLRKLFQMSERLVSEEDAQRIAKEVREDYLAAVEESRRIGEELDRLSREKARGLTAKARQSRAQESSPSFGTKVRSMFRKLFGRA